jgi:hypothetical protein
MGRKIYVARSRDDGASFAPEGPAFERATGACGCCGARALADRRGTLYLLYRAATRGIDRDMFLLRSDNQGSRFDGVALQPWTTQNCPMSSETLSDTGARVYAAWETKGQVYFTGLDPMTKPGRALQILAPPGAGGQRKHPAIAGERGGEIILVWTEGTGWQRGGSLAWQTFDAAGHPTAKQGRLEGAIPVWGLATVVARPDGRFTIIH